MPGVDGAALLFRIFCRATEEGTKQLLAVRPDDPYAGVISSIGKIANALDSATADTVAEYHEARNEPNPEIKVTVKE